MKYKIIVEGEEYKLRAGNGAKAVNRAKRKYLQLHGGKWQDDPPTKWWRRRAVK